MGVGGGGGGGGGLVCVHFPNNTHYPSLVFPMPCRAQSFPRIKFSLARFTVVTIESFTKQGA